MNKTDAAPVLLVSEVRTHMREQRRVLGPREGWVPAGECWTTDPAGDAPDAERWLREVVAPEVDDLLVEGATLDGLERDGWVCEVLTVASVDGVVSVVWHLVCTVDDGALVSEFAVSNWGWAK